MLPRIIRVCCYNRASELSLLTLKSYRVRHHSLNHNYLSLNIWTLEATTTSRQCGLLLSNEDLEVIALLPSIDAVENYIHILQDEAAAKFYEAIKE